MSLQISLIIASTVLPVNVTNVFHINVIVVGENIFQVWNIPRLVHPILSFLFSTIITVCFKSRNLRLNTLQNASFY